MKDNSFETPSLSIYLQDEQKLTESVHKIHTQIIRTFLVFFIKHLLVPSVQILLVKFHPIHL